MALGTHHSAIFIFIKVAALLTATIDQVMLVIRNVELSCLPRRVVVMAFGIF